MANFVVYTYQGDEDLFIECLRSLQRVRKPSEKVFVMDDEFEPMSEETQLKLKSAPGVVYERTYHPRQGNLIGPAHTKENFKILTRLAKDAEDGVVVKVDCDTLVLARAWLDEFIADQTKDLAGGFHSQVNYMFGMCYALKAHLAQRLLRDVEINPPWVHCFEDYEVSHRVHRWDPTRIKRFALTKPMANGWVVARINELPPGVRAAVLDVNRGDPRAEVLKVMRGTNDTADKAREQQEKTEAEAPEGKEETHVDKD